MRPNMPTLLIVYILAAAGSLCAQDKQDQPADKNVPPKAAPKVIPQGEQIDKIIDASENLPAAALFTAAAGAMQEKRIEDGGFLFYAGQIRRRTDQIYFPAEGKGGNSPQVLFGALNQVIGQAINPQVMENPAVFERIYGRLKDWRPNVGEDYKPEYSFAERKTEDEAARAAVEKGRAEFLEIMRGNVLLLKDPEYFAAFQVVRQSDEKEENAPSPTERNAAERKMRKLEKAKGFQGIMSVRPSAQARLGWKAEEYFEDPKVVDLCHAIEDDDLEEIERLIKAGANVNAQGRLNMTPLLWAYPDGKLERFELLLKHGADPNVRLEDKLDNRGYFLKGDAVTHLACKTGFKGYFEAVFAHGGDPNLMYLPGGPGEATPLMLVIDQGIIEGRQACIDRLLELGADINAANKYGKTALMEASSWNFALAAQLLEAGADPKLRDAQNKKAIHFLARWEPEALAKNHRTEDHRKLVTEFERRGESMEDAKTDLARWKSFSDGRVFGVEIEKEIEARLKQEALEKAKK